MNNTDDATAHAISVAQKHSSKLTYHSVDVTNEKAHSDVLDQILAQARYPLRGAVCCAGITQEAPAINYPPSDFQKVLNVNTVGVFLTAQLSARAFISQRVSGSIVLVASMSGSIANRVSIDHPVLQHIVQRETKDNNPRVYRVSRITPPKELSIKCVAHLPLNGAQCPITPSASTR